MKVVIALACAAVLSITTFAGSTPVAKRDQALKEINACLQRNEISSRQCKHLNKNVEALAGIYRAGDKSVLPTLFHFTYLTDFLGEALLADPNGFLTAAAKLPRKDQQEVADGIAGGRFGLRSKEHFESLRALLNKIPESSPTKEVAQTFLKTLETNNASWFIDYFPPGTFTGHTAAFHVFWFSRDMYSLGEKPLWPVASRGEAIYRLTYLGAFTGPRVVTLTVAPPAATHVSMKRLSSEHEIEQVADTSSIPPDQLAGFFAQFEQAHFRDMPTELPTLGLDGAEWILEAVQNASYKIVVRWCPQTIQSSAQEAAFAAAARMLFEIAGQKHAGTC